MRSTGYNTLMRDVAGIANRMNRLYDGYDYAASGGAADGNGSERKTVYRLPVDVLANDDAFHIQAYLPGVNAEDVSITFEGDDLRIHGSYPALDGEAKYARRELFHGEFERRLAFSVPVNADAIEALFENGVLNLHVPKAEEVRPKQIAIQTK